MTPRKCHVCGKPATRRISPDLDIAGIPLCDSQECWLKAQIELWEELRKMEEEQ